MEFSVGDKIEFTSEEYHTKYPEFYPPVGTKGVVTSIYKRDNIGEYESYAVYVKFKDYENLSRNNWTFPDNEMYLVSSGQIKLVVGET